MILIIDDERDAWAIGNTLFVVVNGDEEGVPPPSIMCDIDKFVPMKEHPESLVHTDAKRRVGIYKHILESILAKSKGETK